MTYVRNFSQVVNFMKGRSNWQTKLLAYNGNVFGNNGNEFFSQQKRVLM